MSKKRDYSLDYLKGVGCILMVIAHLAITDKSDALIVLVGDIGSLGMLYFFSVAGVTAVMQVERYDAVSLLKFFLLLGALGTCYTAMVHPDVYREPRIEVFQIIAIGSIAMVLIQHFFKPHYLVYLLLAIGVYLIKLLREKYFPTVDAGGVLFPHHDYIYWDDVAEGDPKINPAFPIIPWLAFFMAGPVAYQIKNQWNILLGSIFAGLAILAYYYPTGEPHFYDKWDMTRGYFCVAFSALFFSFYTGRRWFTDAPKNPNNILLFFGQNSLLFFYVHIFGLLSAYFVMKKFGLNQYVGWITAITVGYFALRLASKIKPSPRFLNMRNWSLLAFIILAVPLLIFYLPHRPGPMQTLIGASEMVLGLIFVINFPQVGSILKRA